MCKLKQAWYMQKVQPATNRATFPAELQPWTTILRAQYRGSRSTHRIGCVCYKLIRSIIVYSASMSATLCGAHLLQVIPASAPPADGLIV